MSDDLIERLERRAKTLNTGYKINAGAGYYNGVDAALDREAAVRIRELEAANYRLTEERDRLKSWADKYHDEVLELRALKPKADE